MPAPTPPLVIEAFANAADPAYIDLIPETTADPERASLDLGFPPQTMQPVIAGGTPPFGQDMNGILFMISSHTVYQQTGQPYYYNATLAAKIGGYGVGTILGMQDGAGFWINRTAANLTDPDAGGAGWVPMFAYGVTTLAALTGGVVTLTAAQAKMTRIVLQGTLTSNLQIVVPGTLQRWLVVNQCTGAFTTTVKTAAGTGVVIPQGGSGAPVEVYGDGTNIYPTVAPVNLPIDQAATPSTIVQRTNTADILARFFNMNAGTDNITMDSVCFTYNNDGYIRRITPVNFAAQLALSWFAGQVSNAQVPFSAVLQYAAALFTSPAFTGVPTAPTAGIGTANTQLATTQFVMSQAIGNAQAWTNPARAFNTTYTNSSGRAMQVNVCCGFQPGANSANLQVSGVTVAVGASGGSAANSSTLSAIVPPGATYRINTGGSVVMNAWAELG